MSAVTEAAVYAYALTRPADPTRLVGLRGVDGAPVRLVCHDDVALAVSTLSSLDGGAAEAALADRLELEGPADLAELESLARAHHAVVDALADLVPRVVSPVDISASQGRRSQGPTTQEVTTLSMEEDAASGVIWPAKSPADLRRGALSVVVPFRLATVYLDDERVAAVLRRRHRQFRLALDRVAGRVELGVKVYAVPNARPEPDGPEHAPGTTTSASPGRDYLRSRRQDARRREHTFARATAAARQLDHDLAKLADDVTHHRPQDPQLSGAGGENVLNVAYLVDAGLVDAFVARSREGDTADGVEVVVTGPWAPYSFATVTEEAVG